MLKKLFRLFVAIFVFSMIISTSFADLPPDPGEGGGPGSGDQPVGGGSPIGGGLIISMTLAAIYGTRKVVLFQQKK